MKKSNVTVSDSPEAQASSDEELLQSYINGNQQSFNALMNRYDGKLIAYLRQYLGSQEDAEDVYQHTWLNISEKANQFSFGKTFQAWIYGIATHAAIDFQRKSKRHNSGKLEPSEICTDTNLSPEDILATLAGTDREGEPVDQLIREETIRKIQLAITQLSEEYRIVLQLVDIEGIKYGDVATKLEIPVGTVKSRLYVARIKLRSILAESSEEEDQSQMAA